MRPKPLRGGGGGALSVSIGGGAVTGVPSGRDSSVVTSSPAPVDFPRRGPLLSFRCAFIIQSYAKKRRRVRPRFLKKTRSYGVRLAGDGANAKHQELRHNYLAVSYGDIAAHFVRKRKEGEPAQYRLVSISNLLSGANSGANSQRLNPHS
jgi:hypothetical protein